MAKRNKVDYSINAAVQSALDTAYIAALGDHGSSLPSDYGLAVDLRSALDELSEKSQKAATGFTNIFTCLAIKAAMPSVDIRYHQVQIQDQTPRPANFNFRGVSEAVVYPWLNERHFEGAKSGWQTRTFERPKPYKLTYDENIGDIKKAFLSVFHQIEECGQSAPDALKYLCRLQIVLRDKKVIDLSLPRTTEIRLITDLFRRHFFHPYSNSKGASRLPVLALYAIYGEVLNQAVRYKGMQLRKLQEHSAADAQTGAAGDIEIEVAATGETFEAVEVKHNIPVVGRHVRDALKKIGSQPFDRYYILTTHPSCEPDEETKPLIAQAMTLYRCQLICNGVIPSIRYYLRLLADPSVVLPGYLSLLKTDKAIAHEHREVWNQLVNDLGAS